MAYHTWDDVIALCHDRSDASCFFSIILFYCTEVDITSIRGCCMARYNDVDICN